jgi:hypothetical protein
MELRPVTYRAPCRTDTQTSPMILGGGSDCVKFAPVSYKTDTAPDQYARTSAASTSTLTP